MAIEAGKWVHKGFFNVSLEISMIKALGFSCLFFKEWPDTDGVVPRRVLMVRARRVGGGAGAEYFPLFASRHLSLPMS